MGLDAHVPKLFCGTAMRRRIPCWDVSRWMQKRIELPKGEQMNRREFVQATLIGGTAASTLRAGVTAKSNAGSAAAAPPTKLFPTDLPELQWHEFHAAG